MTPFEWTWTLRFGQYARGTVAAVPGALVVPVLVGGLVGVLLGLAFDSSTTATAWFAVEFAVLIGAAVLVSFGQTLRRLRRSTGSGVQRYSIAEDAVEVLLGQDRVSLPRADLVVARTGRDWIALGRRGMRARRIVLFFDDPLLVPQALGLLRPGAATPRS